MELNRRIIKRIIDEIVIQEGLESHVLTNLKHDWKISTDEMYWERGVLYVPTNQIAKKVAKAISDDGDFLMTGKAIIKNGNHAVEFKTSRKTMVPESKGSKADVGKAELDEGNNQAGWMEHGKNVWSTEMSIVYHTGGIKKTLLPDIFGSPITLAKLNWKTHKDLEGDYTKWEAKYKGYTFIIWND